MISASPSVWGRQSLCIAHGSFLLGGYLRHGRGSVGSYGALTFNFKAELNYRGKSNVEHGDLSRLKEDLMLAAGIGSDVTLTKIGKTSPAVIGRLPNGQGSGESTYEIENKLRLAQGSHSHPFLRSAQIQEFGSWGSIIVPVGR